MTDEIDRAQEREQHTREAALRRRKLVVAASGGTCLYCGDKLPRTRRWCNADCRDNWEAEQARAAREGDGADL